MHYFCTDGNTEAQKGSGGDTPLPPALTPLCGALSGGICRAVAVSATIDISGPNSSPSEGKRQPDQSPWYKPNLLYTSGNFCVLPRPRPAEGSASTAPFPSLTPTAAPARAWARWVHKGWDVSMYARLWIPDLNSMYFHVN